MILLVNPPCPPGHVSNKDTMAGLGELYGPNAPVRMPPLDLFYAAAMCRVHYRRFPEPLPEATDLPGQARLWKLRYNSPLGAGTEAEYIANYEKYVPVQARPEFGRTA